MHDQDIPNDGTNATRPRYRGWLYIAQHGPDEAIRGLAVCVDYASACLSLAGVDRGDIWLVHPDEGEPLRKYLAGGPPPLRCPMRAHPDQIIAYAARVAGVSKATCRLAVEDIFEDRGGVGAKLYAGRGAVSRVAKIVRFDHPAEAAA